MKRGLIALLFTLASLSIAAQQVDPASQINWPNVTGSGLPGKFCPTTTLASTTLGSPVVSVASPIDVFPYQTVTGAGIPSGTTVKLMFGDNITLSTAATATATGVTLSFYSYGMPYIDTAGNVSYSCSATGWITGSGVSLTTNGKSGPATLNSGVLNIPIYTGSVGDSDVTNQTASQGTVNLVGTVPSAGKYRINYYVNQNALCGTGTVSVSLGFTWTDAITARAVRSITLTLGSTQLSSGSIQGSIPIYAALSSAITYTSTVTGSCATGGPSSYDAHISVEAVQ